MEEILQKAKELGIMIAESEIYMTLKDAEANQLADPEAQKLMMNYAMKRDALNKKASNPDITKEDFEKIKSEAQNEFDKICENNNIKAYLDANRAFSSLINQVNSIIGYFVKGEDQSGCSGSCSSCGKCH